MSKEHEINKLKNILQIPIEDISQNSHYTEVYTTNRKLIGNIPNFIAGSILHYDTGEQTIGKLQWATVYSENQTEIDSQIKHILAMEDVDITVVAFHKLLAKNSNGETIGVFKATYQTNKWDVNMIGS